MQIADRRQEFYRGAIRVIRARGREVRLDKKVRRMAWVLDGSDAYRSRAELPLNLERTREEIAALVTRTELEERVRERAARRRLDRLHVKEVRRQRSVETKKSLMTWRYLYAAEGYVTE